MTREEFTATAAALVERYIENTEMFDSDPQLRVNPLTLEMTLADGAGMRADIELSDEALEEAAASQGDAAEDASDRQVRQNPDYYPLRDLIVPRPAPGFRPTIAPAPDLEAISALASAYSSAFTA